MELKRKEKKRNRRITKGTKNAVKSIILMEVIGKKGCKQVRRTFDEFNTNTQPAKN